MYTSIDEMHSLRAMMFIYLIYMHGNTIVRKSFIVNVIVYPYCDGYMLYPYCGGGCEFIVGMNKTLYCINMHCYKNKKKKLKKEDEDH